MAKRSAWLIIVGIAIAGGVSAASIVMAFGWSNKLWAPDPNGPLVQTLQGLWLPALFVSPIGLVFAAYGAGVRSALGWIAVLVIGLPVLAFMALAAAIWLGGLAGEPF